MFSNRDKPTLPDKMILLLDSRELLPPFYFAADAYYANGKMVLGMLATGNHLVTRVKSNSVARFPAPPAGQPAAASRQAQKVRQQDPGRSSIETDRKPQQAPSPDYGEQGSFSASAPRTCFGVSPASFSASLPSLISLCPVDETTLRSIARHKSSSNGAEFPENLRRFLNEADRDSRGSPPSFLRDADQSQAMSVAEIFRPSDLKTIRLQVLDNFASVQWVVFLLRSQKAGAWLLRP